MFPSEARERLATYKSRLTMKLSWSLNGVHVKTETRELGLIPVMVRVSSSCR